MITTLPSRMLAQGCQVRKFFDFTHLDVHAPVVHYHKGATGMFRSTLFIIGVNIWYSSCNFHR